MKTKIKGDKEFLRKLKELSDQVLDEAQADVEAAARGALAASRSHVPVNTGQLASSGYVDPPRRHDTAVSCSSGYEHEYAAHIHEGWRYGVKGPPPKFLTKGANSVRRSFISNIVARIASVFKRNFG